MSESEWISLRQAAEILGVHPATVRNWADKGDLATRRTPGGHRRFRKADLLQYAESQGELQPLEIQVIIQNALGQTRMQVGGGAMSQLQWYESITEESRVQLRQEGLRTLEGLRGYLASGAPDDLLGRAINTGKNYATLLNREGLKLPDAIRGFFYFSDFIINSILTWSEITLPRTNSADWGTLLRQVNTFTNSILLSIVEYYQEE